MFVSAHKWWWKWFRPCLIKDSSGYNSRDESHSVPVLDDWTHRSYSCTVRYRWKKILQIERLLFRFLAKFRASKGSPTSILSCDCRNVLIKHAFIRSEMLACHSTAGPGSALRLNWREGNAGEISYHSHSNERRPPTAELIFGSTARHQNRLVWTPAGFFLLLFSLRLHFHPSIHPSTQVGMDGLYYSSCCWIWAFICWFVWSCRVVFSAREITQVSLSLSLLMFTGMLLSLSKCLHSYPVSATSCTCLHW
jgi:hypothetical protein